MAASILPIAAPGAYVKARGLVSGVPKIPNTFVKRGTVLYLVPGGQFAFLGFRQGYEYTTAAGWCTQQGTKLMLKGLVNHSSDCSEGDFRRRRFTRLFTVEERTAGTTLVDNSHSPWQLLGWSGPLTYLGERTCVQCGPFLSSPWPLRWEEIPPWIDAFLKNEID